MPPADGEAAHHREAGAGLQLAALVSGRNGER